MLKVSQTVYVQNWTHNWDPNNNPNTWDPKLHPLMCLLLVSSFGCQSVVLFVSVVLFCLFLRSYPAVNRTYYWPCAQRSFLVELGEPYRMPETKPGPVAWKASTLPTKLSIWPLVSGSSSKSCNFIPFLHKYPAQKHSWTLIFLELVISQLLRDSHTQGIPQEFSQNQVQ